MCVLFLPLLLYIVMVPPKPSDLVSVFYDSSLDFVLFLLPEILGGRVEGCIHFFEIFDSTFSHICPYFLCVLL